MLKRLLIINGCVVCAVASILFFTNSKPPALEWHDMSCWNNSTFQVLRNVRPLTEELLRARREAAKNGEISKYEKNDQGKPDDFIVRYVDLLEIIDDLQNKKDLTEEDRALLETKRKAFHDEVCDKEYGELMKREGRAGDDPGVFIQFFLTHALSGMHAKNYIQNSTFNGLIVSLFGHRDKNLLDNYSPGIDFTGIRYKGKNIDLLRGINIIENLSKFKTKFDKYFTQLSPYIIFFRVGSSNKLPLHLDVTPYVSDELRKQGEWKYELIGMVLGPEGHVWAYVKDQFEDTPQWWKVDDYKKIVELKEPPTTQQELQKDGAYRIFVAIYKRIDTTIDTLAQALASIR